MVKAKKVEPIVELTFEEKYPFKWYCISCGSAAEARVALHLRKYSEMLGWSHLYESYLIPMETVLTVGAGGERTIKRERLFAGYLLIRARLTPDFRDLVISTPGVQEILGSRDGVTPEAVPDRQIHQVIAMMIEAEKNDDRIRRKPKIPVGTPVVITYGTFQNFSGIVVEHESTRVVVKVNIFGRPTNASFEEDIVTPQDSLLHAG
jgi:transcriptional antiterminator NusG